METDFSTFIPKRTRGGLSLDGLRRLLFGYFSVVCCVLAVTWFVQTLAREPSPFMPGLTDGQAWFERIKGACDAVRVESAILQNPPRNDIPGHAYAATCYSLAGKLDKAKEWIDRLPAWQRYDASLIVFNVAHPIADSGDDASSGPMMELVLEYQPDNYMALYHAGMSEYVLGNHVKSKQQLVRFLELFHRQDIHRQQAIAVLSAIQTGKLLPVETVRGFSME